MSIIDIKKSISKYPFYELLSPSVYSPTKERLIARAEKYQENENTHIYAFEESGEFKGIVVFEIADNTATILDIAVKSEHQGQGIGSKLIDFIFNEFSVENITAETDDDAIDFYKKYGFIIANTIIKFDTKRYICVYTNAAHYYDVLIDENNDPVHDPEPLKNYMDKWDGQEFIGKMELNCEKSVLEIGVGTGRLAVRVAPLCGSFCGIDISPKTIKRAKENLLKFANTRLICGDFLSFNFEQTFDVIYSSLTFMHIKEKDKAINKIAGLLNNGGVFMLSVDKAQNEIIDIGSSKIKVYPDNPESIISYLKASNLKLTEHYETEFAYIYKAEK